MYTRITIYGLVEKSVSPLFIFWITFLLHLGTKIYKQTIGIPMGTNCVSLFFFFFFFFCVCVCVGGGGGSERDVMKSLSRKNQAAIIEAFNSTSKYLL